MRVCLIAHSDSPWTPHYARHLIARGHEVHVISFHPKPIPGVTVHYVGARVGGALLWLWKALYVVRLRSVARLLAKIRPDVTMATYFRSNGLVGALTKRSPLVVSTRGPGDYEFWLPFGLDVRLARWIARRAERLHASSPELVDYFASIGVARERFEVIPLGIDAAAFPPRAGARPPGPPRIVCTRKHLPIYDNRTIVRALAALRADGIAFEFCFVGSGNRQPFTEREVRAAGLDDAVSFAGEVEPGDVGRHLAWADVYVSATLSDGSPSSLFEAMSVGLFPVVTDIRANRDWLKHGENAFLFPPGDAAACAAGLRYAIEHGAEHAAALDRSQRRVAEELDRDRNLARLERLLASVAGSAR
jgi:glycosyltransferase involved in cell wall biosynthesis